MIRDFFFEKHSINEILEKFVYEYRVCMIIYIIGIIAKYICKITSRINNIMTYIITVDDNILTYFFQTIENVIHYRKEMIFASIVVFGCIWLVLFKGIFWGIAVIFLIYIGGGIWPFLIVGFIIDLIINKIIYKEKRAEN